MEKIVNYKGIELLVRVTFSTVMECNVTRVRHNDTIIATRYHDGNDATTNNELIEKAYSAVVGTKALSGLVFGEIELSSVRENKSMMERIEDQINYLTSIKKSMMA